MPKVTENLRAQWRRQLSQMEEERTESQDGTPLDTEQTAEVDFEIKVMKRLLDLPLGQKFDGQDVDRELREEGNI